MSAEMPPETLAALDESIAHWERLAAGVPGEEAGSSECALCHMFLSDSPYLEPDDCVGCPVCMRTGKKFCSGTPYNDVSICVDMNDEPAYGSPEFKAAAKKELEFLISLRPTSEGKVK